MYLCINVKKLIKYMPVEMAIWPVRINIGVKPAVLGLQGDLGDMSDSLPGHLTSPSI
jgi:hypothetical protein